MLRQVKQSSVWILAAFMLSQSATAVAAPVIDDTPTRVQTTLKVDMTPVGTLRPKAVGEISVSRWTIDCAGMDREHCDWRAIREYIAPLGIPRMRLQAGWARCEKDPGKYDFAWLDQVVFDAKKMGIDTWLELSYGNPSYPGGGGRQLAAGVIYDWRNLKTGLPVTVFWDASEIPSDSNDTKPVEIRIQGAPLENPVWVDALTGNAYAIPSGKVRTNGAATVYSVPAYDSPTFITDCSLLTLDESWEVRWLREHEAAK